MKKCRTFTLREKTALICRVEASEIMCPVTEFHSMNESKVCPVCNITKNKAAVKKN